MKLPQKTDSKFLPRKILSLHAVIQNAGKLVFKTVSHITQVHGLTLE